MAAARLVNGPFRAARRGPWPALLGVGLLAALLRLAYVWAGVGPDEAGYAFIAHQWAHGAPLYDAVWVDRPQGLLLVFRAITEVAYAPWAIRAAALLAGVALSILVGLVGWMLRSRGTGIAAAAICAVVGVGPHIEGFTMNAELAAAVPATAAVACAVRWRVIGRGGWLVAAGLLGATACLMKQSGFDGLVVALVLATSNAGAAQARIRRVGLVLAGAAIPIGAAVIDGIVLGWGNYWFAIYGWRAQEDGGLTFARRVHLFELAMPRVAADLLALCAVALLGLVVCLRRRNVLLIAPLWLAAAFVATNVGGWYWPHYFVQIVPPLALLSALGASSVRLGRPVVAIALSVAAVAPVAVTLARVLTASPHQRDYLISYEQGYETDAQIAAFVRVHSTARDTFYALASRADLYFLSHRRAPIPYLWSHSPLLRERTKSELAGILSRPGRPKFVAVTQPPKQIDSSGRLDRVLARFYRLAWALPGTGETLLIAREATLSATPPRSRPTELRVEP